MNNESHSAFRYGMLTSEVSSTLQDYSDKGALSDENKSVLREGSRFLQDIVAAQELFNPSKEHANGGSAPSHHALDAFNSALDVVLANRTAFKIADVPDLVRFFQRIHRTLQALAGENRKGAARREDVATTRAFFEKFADSMLARLSNPVEAPACRMIAA